ncbi:MAG: hypothetical protein KH436_04865, partial [Firmicutes bacterium]|nr:hypothetical protein [Bacillota bacterium]
MGLFGKLKEVLRKTKESLSKKLVELFAKNKLGDYMVNVARESISDVDLTILVVEPIASIGPQEEGLIDKIKSSHC